jgi:hypothetical protein
MSVRASRSWYAYSAGILTQPGQLVTLNDQIQRQTEICAQTQAAARATHAPWSHIAHLRRRITPVLPELGVAGRRLDAQLALSENACRLKLHDALTSMQKANARWKYLRQRQRTTHN